MNLKILSVYTRAGDDGSTTRPDGGRIGKDDRLLAACGDLDEAVAALGVARSKLQTEAPALAATVLKLQRQFMIVAEDLMVNPLTRSKAVESISKVTKTMVQGLERRIDQLTTVKSSQVEFVIPGSEYVSAQLDLARAIVRRAERHIIGAANRGYDVSPTVAAFVNRASDLVFVLARRVAGGSSEATSHL